MLQLGVQVEHAGLLSYISAAAGSRSRRNLYLVSGAAAATGGGTGTGSSCRNGRGAGTVATVSSCILCNFEYTNIFGWSRWSNGGAVAGGGGTAITALSSLGHVAELVVVAVHRQIMPVVHYRCRYSPYGTGGISCRG